MNLADVLDGKLAALEYKVVTVRLRNDISDREKKHQIARYRRKMRRLLNRLDAVRHPNE